MRRGCVQERRADDPQHELPPLQEPQDAVPPVHAECLSPRLQSHPFSPTRIPQHNHHHFFFLFFSLCRSARCACRTTTTSTRSHTTVRCATRRAGVPRAVRGLRGTPPPQTNSNDTTHHSHGLGGRGGGTAPAGGCGEGRGLCGTCATGAAAGGRGGGARRAGAAGRVSHGS